MKNYNFSSLKTCYKYYDKSILEEQNKLLEEMKNFEPEEKNKNFIDKFKNYTKNKLNIRNIRNDIHSLVTKKLMTPLISATERVVDMILSVNII